MKEIIVEPKYNGKKLNNVLLNSFNGLSLNTIYKALRKKDIRINDTKVCENIIVHTGDHIKIYISDEQLFKDNFNLNNIVYEDENIVIVNKPAGLEVVGKHSLTTCLLEHYKFIAPCHRLDRNTTGLILFAKNEQALAILLEKFKNREIEKLYRTTVYGIPKVKEQLLNAYLFKDKKKSLVYISDVPKKGYVKIATYYKVLEINKNENTSLLEINLLTGKTHQIRAHLAHIGYPIIGDRKVWQ